VGGPGRSPAPCRGHWPACHPDPVLFRFGAAVREEHPFKAIGASRHRSCGLPPAPSLRAGGAIVAIRAAWFGDRRDYFGCSGVRRLCSPTGWRVQVPVCPRSPYVGAALRPRDHHRVEPTLGHQEWINLRTVAAKPRRRDRVGGWPAMVLRMKRARSRASAGPLPPKNNDFMCKICVYSLWLRAPLPELAVDRKPS